MEKMAGLPGKAGRAASFTAHLSTTGTQAARCGTLGERGKRNRFPVALIVPPSLPWLHTARKAALCLRRRATEESGHFQAGLDIISPETAQRRADFLPPLSGGAAGRAALKPRGTEAPSQRRYLSHLLLSASLPPAPALPGREGPKPAAGTGSARERCRRPPLCPGAAGGPSAPRRDHLTAPAAPPALTCATTASAAAPRPLCAARAVPHRAPGAAGRDRGKEGGRAGRSGAAHRPRGGGRCRPQQGAAAGRSAGRR